jgi:hypothetical protein
MSIYITNAKNWCINGTRSCLNTVKNLGSRVVNSRPVQSNLEKISFVNGYVSMRIGQRLFGKGQLAVPTRIQDHVVRGNYAHLDTLIGLGSSPLADRILSPVLDVVESIQKGSSTEDRSGAELVSKYAFPPQILEERFKKFRNFVLDSKLYIPADYFKHRVVYENRCNDIMILVDGQLMRSKEILENFHLINRDFTERMFLPPFIVRKGTDEKYAYLQMGLTQHDVEKDILPYKTLPDEERPEKPMVKFSFCIDSKLESPEDAANFIYHTWCEVINPSGECHCFGLFGKGIVQCPDPSVFRKSGIRSISFEITQDERSRIFSKIRQLRDEKEGKYHFAKYNCATLMKELCNVIDIDISDKDKLKVFDSTITRIKMYAVSSILANLLRNPDVSSKIGTLQEFANLKDHINKLPVTIKDLIMHPISDIVEDHSMINFALLKTVALVQKLVSKVDAEEISKLCKMELIPAAEVKELCRSIATGTVKDLTRKIYNLLDAIFLNYYDYEVGSPGFVYKRLYQEQKNQHAALRSSRCITIM